MPFDVTLEQAPAGYSLTATRPDEEALVQVQEFTSTEDGQHFIQRLEGLPTSILQRLPVPISPSGVDNLLAICRRDGAATVYVNELPMSVRMRARRPVKGGAPVMKSDILDVDMLELGVSIPPDEGFLFLFSVGWRKGLFYDFGPLRAGADERSFDIASILGQAYCHVAFQERFSISDQQWADLFKSKWFPFAALQHHQIDKLCAYLSAGWDPDELIPEIEEDVKARANEFLDSWRKRSSFQSHWEILERAVERFLADDYISCTSLLFPRIEGILRSHHTSLGHAGKPSPKNLSGTAVVSKITNEKCLLLPHRFADYLTDVYFASFNPAASEIDVSRHSVAHGVASASLFNRKSALVGLLVVHQLFYFLEDTGDGEAETQEGGTTT